MTVTTGTPTLVLVTVQTVTGEDLQVQGAPEASFYEQRRDKYLAENVFTETADLADLDRLLFLELMSYRWMLWLSSGYDYDGDPISGATEEQLRKNLKESAPSISMVKNDLGLTKSARDKDKADSVGNYIMDLKRRAKQLGVHRQRQVDVAMTLFNEMRSIIGTFDRSNELERRKTGIESDEDIVDWIRSVAIPRFEAIDEHFRNSPDGQRYWVGTL